MAKAVDEQVECQSVVGGNRVDAGKAKVARRVSFPEGSVQVGEGPTLVCVLGRLHWGSWEQAGFQASTVDLKIPRRRAAGFTTLLDLSRCKTGWERFSQIFPPL